MVKGKLVVGLVGMPGSGKSLVVNVAEQRGFDVVTMGDVVREEAKNRGLNSTPENIGKLMLELRRNEGEAVIATRCLPKIERTQKQKVIVDGVRSLKEVDEFRKHFESFKLMAIHSSPAARFRRLFKRQRSDDSRDWQDFLQRDLRELEVGLGDALAMAQFMVVNEESYGEAKASIEKTLEKVEKS